MSKNQNWVIFLLIAITLSAILIRLIKLFDFALWGSDSGEHYYLINRLFMSGEIQSDYNGWGFAYPYFPGMHLITTAFTSISGVSAFYSFILITPIIAGFSVTMIYLIANRIFRDPKISLISTAFIAVIMPHVYSSSHPMPGSLGGFLLLLCILLLLKTYDNKKFIIPLIISSLALVITHHLSTFFLIISIIGIIISREIFQKPRIINNIWLDKSKIDLRYLTFLITAAMVYWLYYADPFYDRILKNDLPLTPLGLILLVYLLMIFLWIFIKIRKKISWKLKIKIFKIRQLYVRFLIFWILGIFALVMSLLTTVPGTNMETDINALPILIPPMVLISFVCIAPVFIFYYKEGVSVLGWMLAIMISMTLAFLTKSQELLFYRHLPYIFEPIAIMLSLGFVKFLDIYINRTDSSFLFKEPNSELIPIKSLFKVKGSNNFYRTDSKDNERTNRISLISGDIQSGRALRIVPVFTLILILIFSAIFSYPSLKVVSGFEEGTTEIELDSCFWSRESLPNGTTVGSDHRMSSMVFGIGELNASWEYLPKTFHSESYNDIKDELNNSKIPAGRKRIDYILITESIEKGVALKQWETAEPMSARAIAKFDTAPFIKVYDNGDARMYYYVDQDAFSAQF